MQRRLDMVRQHMEKNEIDACVFTSYHNVHYFSDFFHCYFGRPYAFIIKATKTIIVSAGKVAVLLLSKLKKKKMICFIEVHCESVKRGHELVGAERREIASITLAC